ncbi:MAG: HAD family hydrolase [Streptomycetales bacterium]
MSSAGIVARTGYVLLDFDGPVCAMFAGVPAREVADRLRGILAGQITLPSEIVEAIDPFQVLRFAATSTGDHALQVDAALRAQELVAAASALPTPHVDEVLLACRSTGRPVAVVSNNSTAAIERCLTRFGVREHLAAVVGREHADVSLLKPHPHLLRQAVSRIEAPLEACVLVGDSVGDVEAAHALGIPVVGYANKSGKQARLVAAGADAVITSMAELVDPLYGSRAPQKSRGK